MTADYDSGTDPGKPSEGVFVSGQFDSRGAEPLYFCTKASHVRARFPNSAPEQIQSFATESEAAGWIKNESAMWLHQRRVATK
jgi:hypothetical protein